MAENKSVKVGVGCWLFNNAGQVLLGKRLSKHGTGTWAPPGGHLEFGEEPTTCASRELFEETGLKIPPHKFKFFGITNDVFTNENKHYLTVHYFANFDDGVAHFIDVKEPDKCETWQWFNLKKLPSPLFISAQNLLKQKSL